MYVQEAHLPRRDRHKRRKGSPVGRAAPDTMASACEPITGFWGRSPQRVPGTEPLVRGLGAKLPETESFEALVCLKEGLRLVAKTAILSKYR